MKKNLSDDHEQYKWFLAVLTSAENDPFIEWIFLLTTTVSMVSSYLMMEFQLLEMFLYHDLLKSINMQSVFMGEIDFLL